MLRVQRWYTFYDGLSIDWYANDKGTYHAWVFLGRILPNLLYLHSFIWFIETNMRWVTIHDRLLFLHNSDLKSKDCFTPWVSERSLEVGATTLPNIFKSTFSRLWPTQYVVDLKAFNNLSVLILLRIFHFGEGQCQIQSLRIMLLLNKEADVKYSEESWLNVRLWAAAITGSPFGGRLDTSYESSFI